MLFVVFLILGYYFVKWLLEKPRIDNFDKRYILITGCDTGFGNSLSKHLDLLGFQVFAGCLTEKGEDELRKETSRRLLAFPLNVTKAESIANAVTFVRSKLPEGTGLWGVVNNAGVAGDVAPFELLCPDSIQRCLAVNLFGLMDVTRAFLPLVKQTNGRIVNLTSIMGRIAAVPVPYAVSKFGAEAFSDVLRRDMYHQGVTVHVVEPGFFRTNILSDNALESGKRCFQQAAPELQEYYGEKFMLSIEKLFHQVTQLSSPDTSPVINALTHALTAKRPRHRYVVGWDAHLVFLPLTYLPDWLSDWLLNLSMPKPASVKK